jgi:hypothetical protein
LVFRVYLKTVSKNDKIACLDDNHKNATRKWHNEIFYSNINFKKIPGHIIIIVKYLKKKYLGEIKSAAVYAVSDHERHIAFSLLRPSAILITYYIK